MYLFEKYVFKGKFFNSHLFWLNSHPFFARPIICKLNLSVSAPPPLMSPFKVQCFTYLIDFWVEFSCNVMTKQNRVNCTKAFLFEKREKKKSHHILRKNSHMLPYLDNEFLLVTKTGHNFFVFKSFFF